MPQYKEILVKEDTKKVFDATAKYLGYTHDELVKKMLTEFVELCNVRELFPLVETIKPEK